MTSDTPPRVAHPTTGTPTGIDQSEPDAATLSRSHADRIRELNDALRMKGIGGQVMVTRSIAALDEAAIGQILLAVRTFNDFTPDNDPHGEHDCAILEVGGYSVMFKIDYYDTSFEWHSANPADPAVTKRVLTVMLADDY